MRCDGNEDAKLTAQVERDNLRAELQRAEAEGAVMREALTDMLSGWRYIRATHGDLYGVGWDRAEENAVTALATTVVVRNPCGERTNRKAVPTMPDQPFSIHDVIVLHVRYEETTAEILDADNMPICTIESTHRAGDAIAVAINAHDALVNALNWLTHVACGVGKGGGKPEPGEWEAAIDAGKDAVANARGKDV